MVKKIIDFKIDGGYKFMNISVDGDYNEVIIRLWNQQYSTPIKFCLVTRNPKGIIKSLSDRSKFDGLKRRLNSISQEPISEEEWFALRIKHIISLYTDIAKSCVEKENKRLVEQNRHRTILHQKETEMKKMLDNIEEKLLLTE